MCEAMRGASVFSENNSRYQKKSIPFSLSSRKVDVSRADCSDWRRFTTLLVDFDFVTLWTRITIRANSGPVSHALTLLEQRQSR